MVSGKDLRKKSIWQLVNSVGSGQPGSPFEEALKTVIHYKLEVVTIAISVISLLVSIAAFYVSISSSTDVGWKQNVERKREISKAKEECREKAEEILPGFAGGGLTQVTNHQLIEKSGDCFAMRLSQNQEYKSAYFTIYDAWLDEELARLDFGCIENCTTLEEFLEVERKTFGNESADATLEALAFWEKDYGLAPRS